MTVDTHHLQEARTVQQRYREVPIAQDMEESLSNCAVLRHLPRNGQGGSEDLKNVPSLKLVEWEGSTHEKLRLFQRTPPLRSHQFHFVHNSSLACNVRCLTLLQMTFYRKVMKDKLGLKSGSVKRRFERNQHVAADVRESHSD